MEVKKRSKKSSPLMDLIELNRHILKTQMNSTLLHFFWNFGRSLVTEGKDSDDEFLKEIQLKLVSTYGRVFSMRNIKCMILFSKQVTDAGTASFLGNLVSWEHIKLLLELDSPNLILVYSKICMEERYSPSELSSIIKRNEISELNQKALSLGLIEPNDLFNETTKSVNDPKGNKVILKQSQLWINDFNSTKAIDSFLNKDLITFLKGESK